MLDRYWVLDLEEYEIDPSAETINIPATKLNQLVSEIKNLRSILDQITPTQDKSDPAYQKNLLRSKVVSLDRNTIAWAGTDLDCRFKVSAQSIDQARSWLALGATRGAICQKLGISYRTLKRRLEGRSAADIAHDNKKHCGPYSSRDNSAARARENRKNEMVRNALGG